MTSCRVGTSYLPLYVAFSCRIDGIRSTARRVLSSASVKSSVNQPVRETPSITLVGPEGGELRVVGDVGRAADLVLVPGDEDTVLG